MTWDERVKNALAELKIIPADAQDRFAGSSEEELARQVRELELDYPRSLERIAYLEGLIEDVERYDQPVRKLEATRVSANLSAGTFDVSRGRRNGVRGGTVAVARGTEQLVGTMIEPGGAAAGDGAAAVAQRRGEAYAGAAVGLAIAQWMRRLERAAAGAEQVDERQCIGRRDEGTRGCMEHM